MNKQLSIIFLSENEESSKSLYASCKFINYIEALALKYDSLVKISVTENNLYKKQKQLGYKTTVAIWYNDETVESQIQTIISRILNDIKQEYKITIEVD